MKIFLVFLIFKKNKIKSETKKEMKNIKKSNQMGQGGVNSKTRGAKSMNRPGPAQIFLRLQPLNKKRAPCVQFWKSCIRALKQKLTTQKL